ncbi:MAG: NAD(P)H-dependent oxidoreductase subunit E [bacterium]
MDDLDLRDVDALIAAIGRDESALIPILQAIQEKYRYLPGAALRRIPEVTAIRPAAVMGVATFYDYFRLTPAGRHQVCVCHGTACHVKGSERIQEAVERHLKLTPGQDTDPDGEFTVKRVACVGCCTLAPVVVMGATTYGHLTPNTVAGMFEDYRLAGEEGHAAGVELRDEETLLPEIRVGIGSCCIAKGSLKVRDAFVAALKEWGVRARVRPVGCVGMCHETPLVEIVWPDEGRSPRLTASALAGGEAGRHASALYRKVAPEDADRIVREHFRPRGAGRRLRATVNSALDRMLTPPGGDGLEKAALNVRDGQVCAFLGKQVHLATEYCGRLDPLDLETYAEHDGFKALHSVLTSRGAEETITMMKSAGLRGRGGAGFPVGEKWAVARGSSDAVRYAICNGDEGDPGAFMDRMILESYPYRVLEGLAIAAYCVGAHEGFLYIRAEYPLAVKRIREAIGRMEAKGLLGSNVMGSGWSLKLSIKEGAGAFVCGEETALIASIEGRRGLPRLRPPYPAEHGLWGHPTSVNNVETLAVVPWIVRHGAAAHAELGTAHSKGTKVFALTGKVRRGGLIEVPMGISIREIVEEIGGGVEEGRRFKAVQIGGPSGGCLPASLGDLSVDYETLAHAGAIMGSGGLVVLDDRDCMVDMARYFLRFTQEQSCGQCTFCRIGTRRMLSLLDRLCEGSAQPGDLEKLKELAKEVARGSLCALGQTAPNPVLSTLRHFEDEYRAHLEGRCPAGVCKALIRYTVTERCIGCTRCAQVCPVEAIEARPYRKQEIDAEKCTRCDLCRKVCPTGAIEVVDRR